MGEREEAAVRRFVEGLDGQSWDDPQIKRALDQMTPDAHYHVYAWERPVVGQDAIRNEMQRQAPHFSDLHCEILNIASSGSAVFVQRLDSMMTKNGSLKCHLVAVFEVEPDGKIRSWREYYDSKEITSQVGANMTTAGQRA